jgi:hypothetical protein
MARMKETHISYVLIGPRYTYKIKKPVKLPFVDYSTLARRKHFCEEEVRLNRRYSPSVYLGVVPIKKNRKIMDYAVKMKTLPKEKRLDHLLAKNLLTSAQLNMIARLIARFHKNAKALPPHTRFGRPALLKKIVSQNAIPYKTISQFLLNFIERHKSLFIKRLKEGRIKDLHGDLYTENIYYLTAPVILDRIEFNPDFRCIDTAAEISYLLMDLEFRGKKQMAHRFLKAYLEETLDFGALPLLNFYKCHYAAVRGMVCKLEKKKAQARRYYRLAEKYAKTKPLILAVGGNIGTGKSTVAFALSQILDFPLLRSDYIRKKLAHVPLYFHPRSGFRKKLYRPSFTRKTYKTMMALAQRELNKGRSVILDAAFAPKRYRAPVKSRDHYFFIETKLPQMLAAGRLKRRRRDISDARPWLIKLFKGTFEPLREIPPERKITINTAKSKAAVLRDLFLNPKFLENLLWT